MNWYRFITYVLVVSNIIMLVAMFIAAFWGFTYPKIIVDGYESGKSAFVATFMCFLAGICLCGLNFQNYYLLVTYSILHLLIMLNQIFSLLPFNWTRIPNYPLTGSVNTQVWLMVLPKTILAVFALTLAYKLRRDEKRYELARSGAGLHQRLPCHIVPRGTIDPGGGNAGGGGGGPGTGIMGAGIGSLYGTTTNTGAAAAVQSSGMNPGSYVNQNDRNNGPMRMMGGPSVGSSSVAPTPIPPPPPPNLPPPPPPLLANSGVGGPQSQQHHQPTTSTNQIIQTPPIYPLHRPSVTDVSSIINSPMLSGGGGQQPPPPPQPGNSMGCHRTIMPMVPSSSIVLNNCPTPCPTNHISISSSSTQSHHPHPSLLRGGVVGAGGGGGLIGNHHSSSCGAGLNDISTMIHHSEQQQQLVDNPHHHHHQRSNQRSSNHHHWRTTSPFQTSTNSPLPPMTPTKHHHQQQQQWWPNSISISAKQQQYSPYYRDVYNPNF